jgi:hypothetical protein
MKVLSTQSSLPYAPETMFKPHPQSEARRRSAVTLIKFLLAEKKPEVLPTHYRQLLTVLLWKITEAESTKYKTRFQSQGALRRGDKVKLRHDHVFQRSKMIAALEEATAHKVDLILKKAFGCTVTIKEHSLLSKFDKKYDGWARYRKAGIVVINTQTCKRVT